MPLKTYQEQPPDLNLTPMIDIVFLLVIFFMVGTKFAEMERSVKLNVPRVKSMGSLTAKPAKYIINVYRDGAVMLNHREVSFADLTHELRSAVQQHPDLGVVVRGDAEGAFQCVAGVLSACREAGVKDLGIGVQEDRTRR